MKKTLLIFFLATLLCKTQAQIVFCPPGAEWHYLFNFMGFLPGNTYNETIKYTGDTIEGFDTLKILKHERFFLQCSPLVKRTLIKQKGDTVFFKNTRTQNGWQILYNFTTQPGQSWITTVLQNDASTSTFTYTVDSVKQISVNGFSLKNLFVTKGTFSSLGVVKFQITERFGSSRFLFDFDNNQLSLCDAESFGERLCYQDSALGITQFSAKACDYYTRNTVGIEDQEHNKGLTVFPNPTNGKLTIENLYSEVISVSIHNALGELVYRQLYSNTTNQIDLSFLPEGIYYLIIDTNKTLKTIKLVKV